MKILIVGGNSSVGKALKAKLINDYQVVTAGRSQCDWFLDLSDQPIQIPEDIDVIVHTAAHFGGNTAQELIDAQITNVAGTIRLCEAAVQANVKHFVYLSSIFSSAKEQEANYSVYSISKKHTEELATYYCKQHQLPLTILKPSHLYGVEESFRKHQPFFYHILDKARCNEELSLYGNNDPVRNYLYIDDLTEIICKVIQKQVIGSYVCAYPKNVTYIEIAQLAYTIFGTQNRVRFLTDKPDIPSFAYDTDDSLYQKIGFSPQIGLAQGIQKIANQR